MLAYSTVSQISYMMIGLGIGTPLAVTAALLHCLNHGFFKDGLFLCAGSVRRSAGTRDMNRLGGLSQRMPHTTLTWLIGAGCMMGVPLTSGFASKWMLYAAALQAGWAVPAMVAWAVSLAILVCLPVKLHINPFSLPNAEQEIYSGPMTEYAGPELALWELSHGLEWVAATGLVAALAAPHITLWWAAVLVFVAFLWSCSVVICGCRHHRAVANRYHCPLLLAMYINLRGPGHFVRALHEVQIMNILTMLWKNLCGGSRTVRFPARPKVTERFRPSGCRAAGAQLSVRRSDGGVGSGRRLRGAARSGAGHARRLSRISCGRVTG